VKVFNEAAGKNKTRIGFMPQDLSLIDEFTVKEMIFFFGTIYGLSKKKILNRFEYLVDLLELTNTENFVRNCSGGEKRRLSLAVCMIHEPELLILGDFSVSW
jgi:ABC-type multidrug transport system ATPase subunit